MEKKKQPVKYFVVDAFTDSAFKGNPAAVCFLNDDSERDDTWLQSLAAEFNISETCFLIPISGFEARFSLRWFTPLAEVDLCGHATLASAHCLFSLGLVDSDQVEFVTRSGILTAKRVSDTSELNDGEVKGGTFLIELNFPVVLTCDINLNDDDSFSMITKALNGVTIVDIKSTSNSNIIVELPSSESVNEVQPRMDDILKCPYAGIIVTAAGSAGSVYDFYSRYFAPKFGVDEDPVCGSAHCALAHYWSVKMNKCDFLAYQASRRSGTISIHYDKEKQRVLLRGKAVTVMEGHVLV
ncbi:hypothetical protein V5N11_033508 [Cardamine amara subsp. amara]|uniref:Phenazine biosynthesis PhzC/PhzF protein n=1 Tax=Cardamine amara subsp. amara TaxID=228776 RepID=A0ABD1C6J4_CARAN